MPVRRENTEIGVPEEQENVTGYRGRSEHLDVATLPPFDPAIGGTEGRRQAHDRQDAEGLLFRHSGHDEVVIRNPVALACHGEVRRMQTEVKSLILVKAHLQ